VSCLSVHFGLPPIGWGEEEDEPDAQSGGPFLACGSRGDCHSNSDSALSTYSGLFFQFSFLIYFCFIPTVSFYRFFVLGSLQVFFLLSLVIQSNIAAFFPNTYVRSTPSCRTDG
jgi:hypothetical protein